MTTILHANSTDAVASGEPQLKSADRRKSRSDVQGFAEILSRGLRQDPMEHGHKTVGPGIEREPLTSSRTHERDSGRSKDSSLPRDRARRERLPTHSEIEPVPRLIAVQARAAGRAQLEVAASFEETPAGSIDAEPKGTQQMLATQSPVLPVEGSLGRSAVRTVVLANVPVVMAQQATLGDGVCRLEIAQPDLGHVTLALQVRSRSVVVVATCESADAARALAQQRSALQVALQSTGLVLTHLDVRLAGAVEDESRTAPEDGRGSEPQDPSDSPPHPVATRQQKSAFTSDPSAQE